MKYASVFGDLDGSLAGEENCEDVSQFEDEKSFGSRVSVQVLFADSEVVSGVVSVGLDQ